MVQLSYFQHRLSKCVSVQQAAVIFQDYCLAQGFEHCLLQPQIGNLSPLRPTYQMLMNHFGWHEFDTQQWNRFGFDQQADLIQQLSNSRGPFAFTVESIQAYWHKRRDFDLIRAIFRRYSIRQGIVVPLHQPLNSLGYVVLFTTRCLDLEPFIEQHRSELSIISHCFLEKIIELSQLDDDKIKLCGLSQKEWECLHLAAQGLTEKEMAGRLARSADTIKFHLRNAARKLTAKNRTQAVAKALKLGIIRP
ncbi:helix-turn-helix transcriptional regulator [Umboniibacter marinipuniceus]|uniref:Autoinducer binding domain-containing protein n=1 Tax=Umboniibacter marinipuniceus TaxID=569599 RepID=A0A3M0A883_9GAMM|nr:LuxR family transcriptional regulator [Umboniibacter marinipuniceus]RMA81020.1 autoinducer binding domain-containing protein [Umboniibacter marinipuniceus]